MELVGRNCKKSDFDESWDTRLTVQEGVHVPLEVSAGRLGAGANGHGFAVEVVC